MVWTQAPGATSYDHCRRHALRIRTISYIVTLMCMFFFRVPGSWFGPKPLALLRDYCRRHAWRVQLAVDTQMVDADYPEEAAVRLTLRFSAAAVSGAAAHCPPIEQVGICAACCPLAWVTSGG